MIDAIYFDLDGTLYDLYSIPDWLPRLRAHDPMTYYDGKPKVDLDALNHLLEQFTAKGIIIGVISWCSIDGTRWYNAATRAIKRTWVKENIPCVTEIHVTKYGTPKHKIANIKNSILIDDDSDVRRNWDNGTTINARGDIIQELQKLLDKISNM